MRIFNNFIHLLTPTLIFVIIIQTSWTTDHKINENLLRDILQNSRNDQHWKNSAASMGVNLKYPLRSLKQIDERISDVIAENVLHFGHNLALELAAQDPQSTRSEIFSPLSIMAALSLLTLGAKGKSYQELKQLIGLDSDTELIQNPSKFHEEFALMLNDLQYTDVNNVGGSKKRSNANWRETKIKMAPVRSTNNKKVPIEHVIRVANGLFVQSGYTINPDYSQVLRSIYETEFKTLDFQSKNREARDFINEWVNNATFGKIPRIINSDIDKNTNVILASAVYFKAFWETNFFDRATKEDYFYPDGIQNPPILIQMMATGGIFPFYNAKEYDCRIIGLPYKGNETTMYVIQPNNSSRQKLRELMQILNGHKINNMIDNMERKTTVMVFPKMHLTRSLTLKTLLKNMNIQEIFINGLSDLSLIGGRPMETYAPVAAAAAHPAPPPPPLPSFSLPTPAAAVTQKPTVSFESIHRKFPNYQNPQFVDRFEEAALLFRSRFGKEEESTNTTTNAPDIAATEKPPTTANDRKKRQTPLYNNDPITAALSNLETYRHKIVSYRSNLFVDDIIHKVDFAVDEQGTEAAAATLTYLHRSGTDVVFRGDTPFIILIRHDPTKLPLFYGVINIPEL
ncbi:serpin 28Dc [Cochliomyia hominivorax]